MSLVRRVAIGPRLTAVVASVLVAVFSIAGIGVWGLARQNADTKKVERLAGAVQDAQQVKFRLADLDGWQSGYAIEISSGEKNAASDTHGQRKGFLDAARAMQRELGKLATAPLDASDRKQLTRFRAGFDGFMRADAKAIAYYRAGKASWPRGDAIMNTVEYRLYDEMYASVMAIVHSVDAARDRVVAAADADAHR